ncbi:hypothetical protein GLOTRDRAFT_113540 [Gloeophyllum trabeum ATCC 11539]|uniref:Uncharacterized protein n=1 Tax=Gloeophyllum trabeum (strain ATCC 11539 / FP-39264 / Madison 617) TaxID=670483 RepID=S7QP46_GLOTA|nr:uncharacterized protein GLOTRDRAFT_113540 [Gloeophyllum trabeum ATCC 11539]EPQ61082.1 hypothetical protein GLOTRDRAFT_113540 [Gloeophyllum trabeum ATCC 11539]
MDELVHHCVRELSFDGDLGCSVSRLRDFISEFHSQDPAHPQTVDDAYCAFVWSVIVEHPAVRIGTVPPGDTTEVYIAPQTSAKRKAKERGEAHEESAPATTLDVIEDAKSKSLAELQVQYGNTLRIAVDPETSFAAITGSHIRPSKLSPMVYTALQLITRGRENGISVMDLGKKSGYDQKTCHYLVNQLLDLDHVVKIRRGGVGSNFCIHKYFFERSPLWRQIRNEERQGKMGEAEAQQERARLEEEGEAEISGPSQVHFDPIDARHLSSLPLVKARVVKLLKSCKNNMHVSQNMLIKIGFSNPTKTDRRFFNTRVNDLIAQGVVEKLYVPNPNSRLKKKSWVQCLRLQTADKSQSGEVEGATSQIPGEAATNEVDAEELYGDDSGSLKVNLTLHKQLVNLLEGAGTRGMTLNELSDTLGRFDKRTIELLMTRLEKYPPPAHIADLGVAELMETHGRERRHRYYTVAAYHALVARENLHDSTSRYTNFEFSSVGDFLPVDLSLFYENEAALLWHQDNTIDQKQGKSSASGKPRGRPAKAETAKGKAKDNVTDSTPRQRRNAADPDGAGDAQNNDPAESATPRKRGRPPTKAKLDATPGSTLMVPVYGTAEVFLGESQPPPKKRGRPSRVKREITGDVIETTTSTAAVAEVIPSPTPRKRDRPPKRGGGGGGAKKNEPLAEDMDPEGDASRSTECVPGVSEPKNAVQPARADTVDRIRPLDPGPANVSQLRRENEILQLLQEMGGIALTSGKDFVDAHVDLIRRLAEAREPTSAPVGSRLDRRTIESVLNNLEARENVKTLKTLVKLPTGSQRPARVTYLPHVSQDKLNAFLGELGRTLLNIQPSSVKKVDEEIAFLPGQDIERAALPLQLLRLDKPSGNDDERWSRNIARADQLFNYDDETIRNVLLTENHTRAQLYGFKVGKMVRARRLHLHMLRCFEFGQDSSRIVSFDDRIVDLYYFFNDLPAEVYFEVVSALAYDERLSALLYSEQGRRMPVGEIDQQLHSVLQIGRSRARARILDILEMLRDLEVVTPLEPTESGTAQISCVTKCDYPADYSITSLQDWTPHSAPQYWRFHNSAPIRLWALPDTLPALWKKVPLVTEADGKLYWEELQKVSMNTDYAKQLMCPGNIELPEDARASPAVGRSIRRAGAWNDAYVLSWHQSQYLKKFVDSSTGRTPLEDEGSADATLQRICWVVCAPVEVVREFFIAAQARCRRELEIAEKKARRKAAEELAQQTVEAKALLAQKSAEGRAKREQEWDDLLRRVHPEPLSESAMRRLRVVRTRFMQSGSGPDAGNWEEDILRVVREAEIVAEKLPAPKAPPPAHPPPVIPNAPSQSVEVLVGQRASLFRMKPEEEAEKQPKGKREEKKPQRRSRLLWTKEYDDLAKDASVIIRARCRGQRIDWAAFDQLFPAAFRNSVRQRVASLREAPGAETYMQRLEDKWYELWTRYRGSAFLPDDDPPTPSNFNIIMHIDFLRRHIDKSAILAGFQESAEGNPTILPASIEELQRDYDIVEKSSTESAWDFVWSTSADDDRGKNMARQPFLAETHDNYVVVEDASETVRLAEAASKMVLGTPNEVYDSEVASRMLHDVGEEPVSAATKNMLERGVLSKLHRDPKKPKPGRSLKISDMNQNALGGSFSSDLFQDASALEDICFLQDGEWREWPLLATDGDIAVLIELASENKAEFKVDTSHAQSVRPMIDWNSKRADDDQIETAIHVRFHDLDDPVSELSPARQPNTQAEFPAGVEYTGTVTEHGKTCDGKAAACRVTGSEAVDCQGCLAAELTRLKSGSSDEQAKIIEQTARILHEMGPSGISAEELVAKSSKENAEVRQAIHLLADGPIPVLHIVGYADIVLVSSTNVRSWTVAISGNPLWRTFPRRWLDIFGQRINEVWEAALRAVMGVIVLRPGISQAEVRWRLRAVYDRQEVNETLRYLLRSGFLERRLPPDLHVDDWELAAPNNMLEKKVMWFLGKRHWYQV